MNAPICRIAAVATVCTVLVLAAAGVVTAADVRNLSLRHVGDFTELAVPVPAQTLCDHFSRPAEVDRPFRIVLNFCGVKHALPRKNFRELPACLVREIRTSQYALDPEPIVRVVLDLAGPATYSLRTDNDVLTVVISDPQAITFAEWEAITEATPTFARQGEVVAPVASAEVPQQVSPPPTSLPSRERSLRPDDDRTTTSKSIPTSAVNPEPTVVVEPPPTTEKMSDPYLIPLTGTEPSPVAATVEENKSIAPGASDQTNGPTVPTGETPPSTVESRPFMLPAHPLVLAPEYLDAITTVPGGTVAESSTPGNSVAAVPESEPSNADATPQVWASVTGPSTEPTMPGPGDAELGPPTPESLIDRLKAKFFSNRPAPRPYTTADMVVGEQGVVPVDPTVQGPPTPSGTLDREVLLERIRLAEQQSALPTPVAVAAGPQRPEVHYSDLGRRDPFEPLLKGLRSGFISEDLPSVEALRMVGVLRDEQGAMALLEDMEGHSYILRAGDAVANGRVLSVGDQRVIFSVDEYGFTRTVALQLSTRGSDPSKSLGAATQATEPVPSTVPE